MRRRRRRGEGGVSPAAGCGVQHRRVCHHPPAAAGRAGRREEATGGRAWGGEAGRPYLTRSRKESTVSLLVGTAPSSPSPGALRAEAPAPGRTMKPRATARPEASSVVPRK